jgi:hypothetical protein
LAELNKSFLEITDKNLNTGYFFLFVFSHHNAHAVATVCKNVTNSYIRRLFFNFVFSFVVPLPCIMSEWTKWSVVDASGTTYKYRYVHQIHNIELQVKQ